MADGAAYNTTGENEGGLLCVRAARPVRKCIEGEMARLQTYWFYSRIK